MNRARRGRWLVWLLATLAAGIPLAAYRWRAAVPRQSADGIPVLLEPPAIDLAGADPAVARVIQTARDAVSRSPDSALAWGKLGMTLLANDLEDAARTCLAQAERLDPAEPRWPYLQAIVTNPNDDAAVIASLKRAANGCGDPLGLPRLRLAQALLTASRSDEATNQFQQMLRSDPSNAPALMGMAQLAQRRGDLLGSLAYLQRVANDPHVRKHAHTLMAQIYNQLGNPTVAQRELRLAAELPDDAPWPDPYVAEVAALRVGCLASLSAADRLLERGQTGEAIKLLQQTIREYPDQGWVWVTLAKGLIQEKDWPGALQALSKAAQLMPESEEVQFQWGVWAYRRGDLREAERRFRKATELKPGLAAAHYNRGRCLQQQGQTAQAITAFRTALNCKPNFAAAHLSLGESLLKNGRVVEGVEHLCHAAELNPAGKKAKRLLASVLLRHVGVL